jgi:hypothetical protein
VPAVWGPLRIQLVFPFYASNGQESAAEVESKMPIGNHVSAPSKGLGGGKSDLHALTCTKSSSNDSCAAATLT